MRLCFALLLVLAAPAARAQSPLETPGSGPDECLSGGPDACPPKPGKAWPAEPEVPDPQAPARKRKASPRAEETRSLTPAQTFALIERRRRAKDLVILDVRTPEEFGRGHLRDAVNLDFLGGGFEEAARALNPKKTYLLYCQVGGRSGEALKLFRKLGREAYHLDGGVVRWLKDGLPVVK